MSNSNTQSSWTGWVIFAGIILLVAGIFDALLGLTAVLAPSESLIVAGPENILLFDIVAWGWWHIIIGAAMAVVGAFIFRGATWARVIGIVLVALNLVSQFALFAVQPWWSLVMIALDVLVIYALTVHGRELKD